MLKRTLYFGNPTYIKAKDQQLKIEINKDDEKESHSVPIEDIGILVIDNPQITITGGALQILQEHNVGIIVCNNKRMPSGLMLSIDGNGVQQERYIDQINASEPIKKQMWAQTVIQKIKNQSKVLELLSLDNDYLTPVLKNVKSGDSDNREAVAASYYWKTLFKNVDNFQRNRNGESPNNLLNYGYSVLRSTMARSIVISGLIPTLGIFHKNRYNAYCLADDLMEPYRPYVDLAVHNIINEHGLVSELTKEHKAILLKTMVTDVVINNETSPLMIATQQTANSARKCFEEKNPKLLLYPFL